MTPGRSPFLVYKAAADRRTRLCGSPPIPTATPRPDSPRSQYTTMGPCRTPWFSRGLKRRAAARRGAAAPAPPCGGCLRPGPRSCAACPVLGPTSGPPPGLLRWGAWAARPYGPGPLSPARAPPGPLGGRSWVVAVAGPAPRRPRAYGAPGVGSPLGGPWGPVFALPLVAAPAPRAGASFLRRARGCRRGRCLLLLPGALSRAALAPSPSRPPPPPGAGEAQEVAIRCGGRRRPSTLPESKSSPARGSLPPACMSQPRAAPHSRCLLSLKIAPPARSRQPP